MKNIRDIEFVPGLKVLVRTDFNVPIKNNVVVDDFRVNVALPTIDFLLSKGARVILMSHLESNEGGNPSLEPVAKHIQASGRKIIFIKDYKKAREIIEQDDHGLFLLENLRFFEGEKKNDKKFSQELASLGDVYVNEAFSVSHRAHASVIGVPALIDGYAGLHFEKEIAELSKAFKPDHPFLFILGGAKFETKIPLIERFSRSADNIFIGGALANDLLKAQGKEVGKSIVSSKPMDLSAIVSDPKVLTAVDVAIVDDGIKASDSIAAGDVIADIGSMTAKLLEKKIGEAKFILWNGPFGIYEKGFTWGTEECARLIASNATATKIVGGGDTLAAISKLGIEDKFTFVSSGGGAMLDFLAGGTLPGIEAIA